MVRIKTPLQVSSNCLHLFWHVCVMCQNNELEFFFYTLTPVSLTNQVSSHSPQKSLCLTWKWLLFPWMFSNNGVLLNYTIMWTGENASAAAALTKEEGEKKITALRAYHSLITSFLQPDVLCKCHFFSWKTNEVLSPAGSEMFLSFKECLFLYYRLPQGKTMRNKLLLNLWSPRKWQCSIFPYSSWFLKTKKERKDSDQTTRHDWTLILFSTFLKSGWDMAHILQTKCKPINGHNSK